MLKKLRALNVMTREIKRGHYVNN